MKKAIFLMLFVDLAAPSLFAQQRNLDSLWRPFEFLIGEWVGDGKGIPGQGSGVASFAFDLNKNAIVRKNHSEYPAVNGRPATIHDDLLTMYYEQGRGLRALYVDNEGHAIHYDVRASATGDTVEFLGENNAAAPRFRLLYVRTGERSADVCFDMAMPNAPETFRRYVSGGTRKK
jgi:hypothetical protein